MSPAQGSSLSSPQKPSRSGLSGSARSQFGGLGKHVARQTWQEPFELARAAGRQVGGARPPQETQPRPAGVGGASLQQKQQKPPEPSPEEKRRHSMMQAFREELKEIEKLKEKREQEMRQRREEFEEVKKQREEEAKKAKQPLFEPVTKVKRGILGGAGRMFGIGKKQRQVEIAKTPTN